MLALTRKKQEAIMIDGGIEIRVLDIQGDKVKLGISAPKNVGIHREEIYAQIKSANEESISGEAISLNELSQFMKIGNKKEK